MPRNVLQTLTIVALVAAVFFVAHNFVRYVLRVDGGYSQWTVFSKCTKSCGTGTRFRTRTCNNPVPRFGGQNCSVHGEDMQTFKCNMNPCPVNGGYGPWGEFGECSVTCGGGSRQKERKCNNPEPKYFGKTCEEQGLGPNIQSEPCNTEPCPVDGGFSEWTEFSECTVTCGGGVHERSRECTNPEPAYNGKNCDELGPAMESEICNTEPCPTQPALQDQGEDNKEGNKKKQGNKENEKQEDNKEKDEKGSEKNENKQEDSQETEKEDEKDKDENKQEDSQENKKGDEKGQ
ncbi:coadhesin-like isoform X2 [Oculina patagonica]